MLRTRRGAWWRTKDSGQSLYLIAGGMIFLLGVTGLAIDLTSLYLARSEAQRAADAAALSGAKVFVSSLCTSMGGCSGAQTAATNAAITTGNQNLVGGQSPNIQSSDVTFTSLSTTNPRITVNVQMTAARGDAMPTFFVRVFGITTADIGATATAEAYNPSGTTGPPVGTSCVKPWILPNIDPNNYGPGTAPANACPALPGTAATMTTLNWCAPCPTSATDPCQTAGYYHATFVNTGVTPQTITNNAAYTGPGSNGAIGEPLVLKPGEPSAAPAPSQFYPIQIPPGDVPAQCPSCAANPSGGGAALYSANISCCNTNVLACGTNVNIDNKTGNMQGPTEQGVECLINEDKTTDTGQDTLCGTSVLGDVVPPCGPPFTIWGGPNNPISALRGQADISSSSSIVTVPLYSGQLLCPGGSCGTGIVTIIGFLQVFLRTVDGPGPNQGNVHATIMNVTACGSTPPGGGGGGTVTGGGGQLIPIRLVQPGS